MVKLKTIIMESTASMVTDSILCNKESKVTRRNKMKRSLKKLRTIVRNLNISSANNNRIIPEAEVYEETVISSNASKSKRVSFGEITVKHFPVIMADNPTCKFGPVSYLYKLFYITLFCNRFH